MITDGAVRDGFVIISVLLLLFIPAAYMIAVNLERIAKALENKK